MNRVRRTGKARKTNGGRESSAAKPLRAGRRAAIAVGEGGRTPATGGARKHARMREERAEGEIRCAFGATRVGPLLKRLRLHLATQRFLAECRRDPVWRAGCDDAGLAIERLRLRMHPRTLGARTMRPVRNTRSGRR